MAKLANTQPSFQELAAPYLRDEQVQRMGAFVQHGSTSTLAHCVRVARTSLKLSRALHARVNEADLVAAALLHDFYLYDWHDRSTSRPKHATRHPLYAAHNARELLGVNDHVAAAIESHMWPLPPTRVPASREAWIICIADKWCSLAETVGDRAGARRAAASDAAAGINAAVQGPQAAVPSAQEPRP